MKRDKYGIIVQPEASNPEYQDGGDSAFSTGINAGSGSDLDASLMFLFIKDGQLVRHPFQTTNTGTAPHNDPKATSRDQVIAFFFGLPKLRELVGENDERYITVKQACLNYAKGWRVNSDVLTPANKVYLYKCAGEKPPAALEWFAKFNQKINVLWACHVDSDDEQNQQICMSIIYGRDYIVYLYRHHPALLESVTNYFCGWRDREEIALAFNKKILSSIGA